MILQKHRISCGILQDLCGKFYFLWPCQPFCLIVEHMVENKCICYCIELLPGLHQWQHREYAMYLVTYHQTHASPFLETALSSSKTKLHTYLFHVQQSGHRTSCTCAHSDTIMLHRLLSELRLSINIVSRVDDDGPTTIRFLKQSPVFALYRCVVVTS